MYLPRFWSADAFAADCMRKYQLKPQWEYALDFFGGRNPKKDFNKCSNIFFSNGDIDPWSAGGIIQQVSPDCPFALIHGAAHHLDLKSPNAADND
jgi:lysosomal Pro-X carboxypeptidase